MSSIASLGRAVSGLKANQMGLQITGHNLTNLNTQGYTRQQLLVHDSSYVNVGTGGNLQQVGLGVSLTEIRQVRDEFIDKRLRTETSVLNFYSTKQEAITEIETILDEPYGETLSGIMEDFWKQTQKLSTNPSGVEERLAFIQTADVLLKRANQIFEGLNTYQHHLNNQVQESVERINQITKEIKSYNDIIAKAEINGDNANDYRDQRNLLLDELSTYMDITYKETADGRVTVKGNGYELIDGQFVTEIGLDYIKSDDPDAPANDSGFVIPTWGQGGPPLFDMSKAVNATAGGDSGKLLGLLIARGEAPADSDTPWSEVAMNDRASVDANGNSYMIPKVQKQLSELIGELTSMINETLTGGGIDGKEGLPLFVPIQGKDGRPMTKAELSNLYQTPASDLARIMEDLPKPMVGAAGEGKTQYGAMVDAHGTLLTTYEAYLNGTGDYEAVEAALQAYNDTRTAYETSIKDIKPEDLQVDSDLLDRYNQNQSRAQKRLKCLFTAENLQVNPELLKDGGYNHLATVTGDADNIGDNSLVTKLLDEWSKPRTWGDADGTNVNAPNYKQTGFMDFYAELVSDIGAEGYEYAGKVNEKMTIVNNTTNERLAMGGVSQDEELGNMLKYQYAYNASARMVNVLDGMMDTIINRM